MKRGLIDRLRKLEEATGMPERSMAFVEVYIGETLDGALIRQGVDRGACRGLFIVEGRSRSENRLLEGRRA